MSIAIKNETNTATCVDMSVEENEKKPPLIGSPEVRTFVPIEANHKGRNQVEFYGQPREAFKGLHSPDNAVESKQLGHFAIHRHVIDIETDHIVPQPVANVQKITGTAAYIQNPLAPPEVQFQVAHPTQILAYPLG